ncbi:riboflavin synthase [Nitratifractor salsuginis]|uniref:Riboflavin synthase n=1 Tax=Nitratifractor salsuginis (strain DSM 16511 / JCM 12458 / E9I37-1) TaxID=749222 RepID=E6X242_NITSE|nr:riboflavin synthase [Nitratifractor salsuginis]ADV47111.1 riboflavin synthase, alpha subunit [Nitratifractor salsuginis DSM 16511]
MFTGLIREIGTVVDDRNHILTIRSSLRPEVGDSIAVNGVCLTVTEVLPNGFRVEAADETRRIVPPQKLRGRVHLEPAMRMGDRFEGHIVQGHIDTVGTVRRIQRGENATEYTISVDPAQIAYIIPKGSVAIDGVSLTINEVGDDWFRLTIIPHTIANTLFRDYRVGSKVNIETDLFARYVDHILRHRQERKRGLSWEEVDGMSMSF